MSARAKPPVAERRSQSEIGPSDGRGDTPAPAYDNAPIIFSELASAWGVHDGVASITLEATRLMTSSDGVRKAFSTVAHLRMSMPALRQLRDAIDAVELLAVRDQRVGDGLPN